MALQGSSIASTYLKLLRINTDTMGADDTASYIQDSADTDSALSISTNRVGIGTDSPTVTAHIAGATTQDGQTSIGLGVSDGVNDAEKVNIGFVSGSNYGFINAIETGVSWRNLALQPIANSAANVAMGTTSTSAKLGIKSSAAGQELVEMRASDNTVKFVVKGDGNVGINEGSPAHKLDVDGGIVEQGGVLKENLLTTLALMFGAMLRWRMRGVI